METYIALLRGINVSGQKIIKMATLRELMEGAGFSEVVTYIQSGNVVFKSKPTSEVRLQKRIKTLIQSHFGFEVPVLIRNRVYLEEVLRKNPFSEKIEAGTLEEKKMYYTLLYDVPNSELVKQLNQLEASFQTGEVYRIFPIERVIYFFAANGYGKTKLDNNFFEKKLKCSATTRNQRTLAKLIALSQKNEE